jgi:hypothetical protein
MLRLGLHDEARYPDDDPTAGGCRWKAELGENVITLTNVRLAPCHETFRDINSNNKMDTSWFGLPRRFGFAMPGPVSPSRDSRR